MPPVGGLCAEYQSQNAEGCNSTENGRQIGSETHGLEQLPHSCTFFGADGKYAGYGKHNADGCDKHRCEYGLELHIRSHRIESGSAERHSRQN